MSVTCLSTVDDAIASTLGYELTDTFVLRIVDGRVSQASFSGNDPQAWDDMLGWVGEERPQILSGPCVGMSLLIGDTGAECALALLEASNAFVQTDDYSAP